MIIYIYQHKRVTVIGIIVTLLFMPFVSLASSEKLSCMLTATTSFGNVLLQEKQSVQMRAGDMITIAWKSENATKGFDIHNNKIDLNGSATSSPTKNTKLNYSFTNGSKKVSCEATVIVATGSITTTPVSMVPLKPVLAGTASGVKAVHIQIVKEGATKPLYTSNVLRVKSGAWSTKINRTLEKGKYTILLRGDKKTAHNIIATSSLVIGTPTKVLTKSATTFVVEPLALLVGGTVKAGASVPVSYLQVINIGKSAGTATSFTLKQNGSASTESVIGFTISNDQSPLITKVIATPTSPLFSNGYVVIPVNVVMTPGQMRLFTIKAIIAPSVTTDFGKQLKLDVTSVTTNATMQSLFPIRGTTWTIGY